MFSNLPFTINVAIIVGDARQIVADFNYDYVRLEGFAFREVDRIDRRRGGVDTDCEATKSAAGSFKPAVIFF